MRDNENWLRPRRDRIAAIIDAHSQGVYRGAPDDQCANCPYHPDRWISHVADAVIAELDEAGYAIINRAESQAAIQRLIEEHSR